MDKLTRLVGRVIFGIPFLIFGAGHLMNADKMAGMVPSFVPGGVIWIYFTGVAMIVAAVAIITGIKGRAAAFGLALMLLGFVVAIHLPGLANPDAQMKMMAFVNLMKDTALMGAALVIGVSFEPSAKKK